MSEKALRPDQQELVAIGASVGAGCHPCFNHHTKAGKEAGITVERLRSALGSADRVATEAVDKMSGHIRAHLAFTPSDSRGEPLDDVLAGLGAALGANDRTNIEAHIQLASSLGATRDQIEHAITVAQTTQESAMRLHWRAADRALNEIFPPEPAAGRDTPPEDTGCGCPTDIAPTDIAPTEEAATEEAATEKPPQGDGQPEEAGCGCDAVDEPVPA